MGGHEPTVRLLIEQRANLQAETYRKITALLLAAEHGHELIARFLLEQRADIEAAADSANGREGNRQKRALHYAAGHEATARLLLEQRANLDAKDMYGVRPLHLAAAKGSESTARLLIESQANVNAQNCWGQTAMHYAGHCECAESM